MTVDYRDREYLSQYAIDPLGISIRQAGVPAAADGDVLITLTNETTLVDVFTDVICDNLTLGDYEHLLSSADTQVPGYYTVSFTYDLATIPQVAQYYIQIGERAPAYDSLEPDMKDIVESVNHRFADLFDSQDGGANLETYYQSHFNRNRLGQLLGIAMGRLNTMAQPYMQYTLEDGGKVFPTEQWGSLLETALYIETLKHLIRSYVEQPMFMGANITRLDRRDYQQRWESVLQSEEQMFVKQMEVFKIAHMGFGRPRVLVSGRSLWPHSRGWLGSSQAALLDSLLLSRPPVCLCLSATKR
jgi:hypothetical protein